MSTPALYPCLEIDLGKFEDNVRTEVALLARHGVGVMGVNKVFNGMIEPAEALVRGGIPIVAESRLANLAKLLPLKAMGGRLCLLRSPGLSEIAECIRVADISLVCELEIVRALSREAVAQGRRHEILVMIDMGDLREGLWFQDRAAITRFFTEVLRLPGIGIYGLGTNFNCYGAIKPTRKNGEGFLKLARELESEFGIRFPVLSAGNCTSFHLIHKGQWVEGLNELRIGGLHQFGIEFVDTLYVEGFHHSTMDVKRTASPLYKLKAEIIEIGEKPTVPVGEPGLDFFLKPKTWVDRGTRKRAILAVGRQDLPYDSFWPVDPGITFLGQTSDHTLLDIHDSKREYQLGDIVEFELDYTALLFACNSPGIRKIFVGREGREGREVVGAAASSVGESVGSPA